MKPETSKRPLPSNVRLLGWVSFWNDVASEMVYPLLPTFLLSALGGNKLALGIIEGAAESLASLLKLWSGARSDRSRGRKPFLVFGYTVAAACRPLTAVLNAPWQLLVIRLSDRAGKGIRAAPRDALIVDSTDAGVRGRAFGYQRSMDHLGAAVGPVLATLFLLAFPNQLRWLFALTLVPGIIVVACVVCGLRETTSTHKEDLPLQPLPPRRSFSAMFRPAAVFRGPHALLSLRRFSHNFRRAMLAIFLFTLGNSTDAFLLVRASEVGVPTAWLPMLWCVFNLFKSGLSVVVGGAIDRHGPKGLLLAGWLVYMLAYLGFAYATALWHVLMLFAVYAVFYALAEPSERALVAALCNPNQRGLAFGWFNSAIGIAALPASLLFGFLYQEFGPLAAFGFGSLMALISSVTLFFVQVPLPGQPAIDTAAELQMNDN